MKTILLFGAGKSATALIDYLLHNAESEKWQLKVIDADLNLAQNKLNNSPFGKALAFDINDTNKRKEQIAKADVVISLMPAALHYSIACDCIELKKHLLTASYIDPQMKSLENDILRSNLIFLCEMGLDPGIDHMSAKKIIDNIQSRSGKVESFYSHCGGLVAPESDNNPWHYKISWNPGNVVNAGKSGSIFKKDNEIKELEYQDLFSEKRYVSINGHEPLCWYPNRDSLSYINAYHLPECQTIVRTTLRHPDFIYGWKNIIDLKLTNEEKIYDTNNMSLASFFKMHMDKNGFSEWLEYRLREQFDATKGLLSELVNLVEMEQQAEDKGIEPVEEFLMVDDKGDLKQIDIDDLKINAAATLADKMHDASLTLKQLFFLGMDDSETMINKGMCSAADVLQFALEKKLVLLPDEKDLVIMQHEIEYSLKNKKFKTTSTLILEGENDKETAMAKTVGLPLGIAAKQILNGKIKSYGLQIPVTRDIYEPILEELAFYGVIFNEQTEKIN